MLTTINSGDTAWMLVCSALVFLMTPGLTFLYGGLLRNKNSLSIFAPCLALVCIVSLQWVLFGYSLAFGPDHNGWIGTLAWAGLRGVGAEPDIEYSSMIPHQAFMIYQMMPVILTAVLFLGAFAKRLKFSSFCLVAFLWVTLVYDPIAHWVWGVGGFLRDAGALDFSGGAVVHMNAGAAALSAALVLGKPPENFAAQAPPQNLSFTILGAFLLWLGWFGLNTGRALGAEGLTANAFTMTQVAAAGAGLTWSILDWASHKHPTILGMIMGVVSGLVAITPAAGHVNIAGAILIGVGAAIVLYASFAVIEMKFGYDDSLYVICVHGIGGIWGLLATGLLASKTVNPNSTDGLFYGNPGQFLLQMKLILSTLLYSFGVSYILLKVVDVLVGLETFAD